MESLPTNIKEAFFYKIPVVATNIGGIPELISNNHTGILTSSEDPDELSTKINHILKNQEISNKLVKNAYNFVINEMSWKQLFPKYIKFYTDLLND